MKIFCGGVRGTETITDPSSSEYGGDTTSYWIEHSNGDFLIIDLGSGVRHMDTFLAALQPEEIKVLMSHYHLDHLNGLPKFSPLYDPDISLNCRGPELAGHSCEAVFQRMLSSPLWPIPVSSLVGNSFDSLPDGEFEWGSFRIRSCRLHHFEGCMAYRIQEVEGGPSVVIATDVEWREAADEEKQAFYDLCTTPDRASVLFFDGHMSPEKYPDFKGWGHSTWEDAVEVSRETKIPELYITHHAPQHDDDFLTELEADLQIDEPAARFARQGEFIEIR